MISTAYSDTAYQVYNKQVALYSPGQLTQSKFWEVLGI